LTALDAGDATCIWPQLRVVSCWADGHARLHIPELQSRLPGVEIQPKGLLATEGVVTIPYEDRTPIAIRSHFFEFLDGDRSFLAHEIAPGRTYSVVVTTGGGLYRYRLEDLVEVDGLVGRTPSLRFLGKGDRISDLCGEKLHEAFVARAIQSACAHAGVAPRAAFLAPDRSNGVAAYTLYLESDGECVERLGPVLDDQLASNPQYRYCRTLGQLSCVRIFRVTQPLGPAYLERCRERGQRLGDIKPSALTTVSGWSDVFSGTYATAAGD
jgi:hypothetical protein